MSIEKVYASEDYVSSKILTQDQINALDSLLFNIVSHQDTETANDAYNLFKAAFGLSESENNTTYAVTNNLTNITNSNSDTFATGEYSATLVLPYGYEIDYVTITMGGVDITDDVYYRYEIFIPHVTGDIVITAGGRVKRIPLTSKRYHLENAIELSEGDRYDTGYKLFYTIPRHRTLCMEITRRDLLCDGGSLIGFSYSGSFDISFSFFGELYVTWNGHTTIIPKEFFDSNTIKLVVQLPENSYDCNVYVLKNGKVEKIKMECVPTSWGSFSSDVLKHTLQFSGHDISAVHDFRVYDQELLDTHIESYLTTGEIE